MNPTTQGSSREILVKGQSDDHWTRPSTSTISTEKELQDLIARQPTLVPGVEMGSAAVTELRSSVGPADICIVSPTGELTIVECKLASNAEVRRKIVGQVLDYASQIWQMTFHQLDSRWRKRTGGQGVVESLPEPDPSLSADIDANLASGRFNLVLAVDRINDDLRRIIEYLNHITREETSVMALELRYAEHAGVEILVPSVFGSELTFSNEQPGSSSNGKPQGRWSPAEVVSFLKTHEPDSAPFVEQLFELAEDRGWNVLGTQAKEPSTIIGLDAQDGEIWPYTVYASKTGSVLSTNFQWTHRSAEPARQAFLETLSELLPTLDKEAVLEAGLSKRPGHALANICKLVQPAQLIEAASGLE